MKKILFAAIFCGLLASSCKKEDKTFCYECATTITTTGEGSDMGMDGSVEMEQCGWTEEEGKAANSSVTTSVEGMKMTTTTVCNKK